MTSAMGPPPPRNPNPAKDAPSGDELPHETEWSGPPCHKFNLEILKDGSIIDQFDVFEKGAYMFGRVDLCDFVLEHPTVSRFHAVLQFKRSGDAYLYDVGSTHGTFINKSQVEKRVYVALHVGDVIRFGQSSRLYIFQGPQDLMPPEANRKVLRNVRVQQEMLDREASLHRARMESSLADGISWGMDEDAIEEAEDDTDEITWQTYKGQLTEKQEKTRDKIVKRNEKIGHMRKEIDAIRAKDISQGGLTQGQQTQIARNDLRITQLMEELESLEETLNESIRESLGARSGRIYGGKKGATEEEQYSSDEDDFYDRTKKRPTKKAGETQSVETADSLLDKRDALMNEMQEKKDLFLVENIKITSETDAETEAADELDAYMSGLSTQLVVDKTKKLEKELAALQSELDRIVYLLKIADPSGEFAKKRELKIQGKIPDKTEVSPAPTGNQLPEEPRKAEVSNAALVQSNTREEAEKIVGDPPVVKATPYVVAKPQWLGAVNDKEVKETVQEVVLPKVDESDQFVDYKDRQKILQNADDPDSKLNIGIEGAAPGLIIRKRKEIEGRGNGDREGSEQLASAEFKAEDAVALLLKHEKGYHLEEEESNHESQGSKDTKKPKRVLGPQKPSFLQGESEKDLWMPPKGECHCFLKCEVNVL
ncbi:SLC4A1AP [Linum perenne]